MLFGVVWCCLSSLVSDYHFEMLFRVSLQVVVLAVLRDVRVCCCALPFTVREFAFSSSLLFTVLVGSLPVAFSGLRPACGSDFLFGNLL